MAMRVLFVRAVNVGGTARLPMAEFRAMLEDLGVRSARTYIASGNAVVDTPGEWTAADCATFDVSVERELEARFGFHRNVFSRSVEELEAALEQHPFAVVDPKWSYIAFLDAAPAEDRIARACALATGDDEWALRETHLHIRFAQGMSTATLSVEGLLQRLGVIGTARNLRTVRAVIDLAHR